MFFVEISPKSPCSERLRDQLMSMLTVLNKIHNESRVVCVLADPLGFEPRVFGFLQPRLALEGRRALWLNLCIHAALRIQFCALKEEGLG